MCPFGRHFFALQAHPFNGSFNTTVNTPLPCLCAARCRLVWPPRCTRKWPRRAARCHHIADVRKMMRCHHAQTPARRPLIARCAALCASSCRSTTPHKKSRQARRFSRSCPAAPCRSGGGGQMRPAPACAATILPCRLNQIKAPLNPD